MLVDITTSDRIDEVSSHGYAWGYIGSCIPFTISLLLILGCDTIGISATLATAIAFIMNALWWLLITIPLLKNYKQVNYNNVKEPIIKNFKHLFSNIKIIRKFYFSY